MIRDRKVTQGMKVNFSVVDIDRVLKMEILSGMSVQRGTEHALAVIGEGRSEGCGVRLRRGKKKGSEAKKWMRFEVSDNSREGR